MLPTVTLKYDTDMQFAVNRKAICRKSPVFNRIFNRDCEEFSESAYTGWVRLTSDDPKALAAMAAYLDSDDYNDSQPLPRDSSDPFLPRIDIVALEERLRADPAYSDRVRERNLIPEDEARMQTDARYADHVRMQNAYISAVPLDYQGLAVHHRILGNIKVYDMAEKYDVPGLKALVIEKVKALLGEEGHWPFWDLASIVRALYTKPTPTPTPSAQPLRDVVADVCARHYAWFLNDPACQEMVRDNHRIGEAVEDAVERRYRSHFERMDRLDEQKTEAAGTVGEGEVVPKKESSHSEQQDDIEMKTE